MGSKKNKMKAVIYLRTSTMILVVVCVLLIIGGYFLTTQVINPYLEKQKIDAYNLGMYKVAYEQTNKSIFFYIDENNYVNVISLQQLCQGGI
jgi:hypothetical protein